DPDRFRPDLASALNNLGNRHSEAGDPRAGLPCNREAVEIFRELVNQDPDRFRPALATALGALGQTLHRAGDTAQAFDTVRESFDLFHALAKTSPRQHGALFHGTVTLTVGLALAVDDIGSALTSAAIHLDFLTIQTTGDPDRFRSLLGETIGSFETLRNQHAPGHPLLALLSCCAIAVLASTEANSEGAKALFQAALVGFHQLLDIRSHPDFPEKRGAEIIQQYRSLAPAFLALIQPDDDPAIHDLAAEVTRRLQELDDDDSDAAPSPSP
ncbi:MAG: tetratricopeptide repeat protein, partial [Planctomycetota bacterium]